MRNRCHPLASSSSCAIIKAGVSHRERMMLPAPTVTCPHCSAPVPVLDRRGAQCLYCMRGVPVLAEPGDQKEYRALKRRVTRELAISRRIGDASAIGAVVWVIVCGVLAASASYAAYWETGNVLLAASVAASVLALLFCAAALRHARHWRAAATPPASVRAGSEFALHCHTCDSALDPSKGPIARCGLCRAKNLLPAVGVASAGRPRHGRLLSRRRSVPSTRAVTAVARSHRREASGWTLLLVAGIGASVWAVFLQGVLDLGLPSENPIVRFVVPGFFATILAVFGSQDVVSSWLKRRRIRAAGRRLPA